MNMRGAPGIGVISPWISSRLDGKKVVTALRIGQWSSTAAESGIERCVELVPFVHVPSGGIRLPYFDQRAADWAATFIQQLAADCNSFSQWWTVVQRRQIAISWRHATLTEH